MCLLLFPLADELLAEAAVCFMEEQIHRLDGIFDAFGYEEQPARGARFHLSDDIKRGDEGKRKSP